MTRTQLIDWLEAEIAAFPGKTSLLMVDTDKRVEVLSHDPDVQVASASTIKVPILLTALDLVANNRFSMDRMVPMGKVLKDTVVFEAENLREEYTLLELLEWMIVLSDNTAANAVIDLIGMDAVNGFCARVGASQTVLQRHMLDQDAQSAGKENLTSAKDQYLFYAMLAWCARRGDLWQLGLEMLRRQRCQDAFLRYLWGAIPLAHKPGELPGVCHDAGLFLHEGNPFYLGIFTWDGPGSDDRSEQKRFIGKLTRKIYNWRMGYE